MTFDVSKARILLKYLARAYSTTPDHKQRSVRNDLVRDFLNIKRLLTQARREGVEPDRILPLIERAEKIKKKIKEF